MEWQPIETAPKDGTPILAHSAFSIGGVPYEDMGVVAWDERSNDWRYQANGVDAIESQSDFGTDYAVMSVAEFWQPLPDGPKPPVT